MAESSDSDDPEIEAFVPQTPRRWNGDLPAPGRYEPSPGRPACAAFHAPGVTPAEYDRFKELLGIGPRLPQDCLARIELAGSKGVTAVSAWSDHEAGREFFRQHVFGNLETFATSGAVPDVVRHEYRLATLTAGARAGEIVEDGTGLRASARGFFAVVRAAVDERDRTLAEAYRLFERIARSPELAEELADGLLLVLGGVTVDGMLAAWIHADAIKGRSFINDALPSLAAHAFSDWPPLEIEIAEFRIHTCAISLDALAGG